MTRKFLSVLLSSAALLSLPAVPAWAKVGVASVVDGEPIGLPPGGSERVLRVGIDMNADEKVTTKDNDRAHLVFLDGTSLTVGPNSVMVIDKFVYDPEKKIGEMALKVERGSLRFVGGIISKKSEVKIDTPSAVMGIRGGILTVSVSATGQTTARFLFGASFSITSEGVTRTVTTPGMIVNVSPGLPPTVPTTIPPGGLTTNVATFEQTFQPGPNASGQGGGQQNLGSQGGGNRPGGANGPTGGGKPVGVAITLALTNAGLSKVNSGMTPGAVIAATPPPSQVTLLLTTPQGTKPGTQLALSGPGGQQQGNNGQQGQGGGQRQGNTLQGGGPLLGGAPLQGAGALVGAGPLQGAGPLLGAGPLQGAGPLLGAGPLQGGGPLLVAGLQGAAIPGAGPLYGTQPLLGGGPLVGTGPVLISLSIPPSGPSPILLITVPLQQLQPLAPLSPVDTTTPAPTPPTSPTPPSPQPQVSNPPSTPPTDSTPPPPPTPTFFTPTPGPAPPPANNIPPQSNGTPS